MMTNISSIPRPTIKNGNTAKWGINGYPIADIRPYAIGTPRTTENIPIHVKNGRISDHLKPFNISVVYTDIMVKQMEIFHMSTNIESS